MTHKTKMMVSLRRSGMDPLEGSSSYDGWGLIDFSRLMRPDTGVFKGDVFL
jgi:hypothetical protein